MISLKILPHKLAISLRCRSRLLVIVLDKLAYIGWRLRGFIHYFLEELFWLTGIVIVSAKRPGGRGTPKIVAAILTGCGRLGSHHSVSCDFVSGDREMIICETLGSALEAIVYAEFFKHLSMTACW